MHEGLENGREALSEDTVYKTAVQNVIESREWFKIQYSRMTKIAYWAMAMATISLAVNIGQILVRPNPMYYAMTPDLRLKEMIPLSEPYITQEGLLNWTVDTATRTLSLDFNHWRSDLNDMRPNYTDKAFRELVLSMKNAGTIEMLEVKRLSMTTTIRKAPIVKAAGEVDGVMTWAIEFPVLVSYESSQGVFTTQPLDVTIKVLRVSLLDSPRGIKIGQMVMKPGQAI